MKKAAITIALVLSVMLIVAGCGGTTTDDTTTNGGEITPEQQLVEDTTDSFIDEGDQLEIGDMI